MGAANEGREGRARIWLREYLVGQVRRVRNNGVVLPVGI